MREGELLAGNWDHSDVFWRKWEVHGLLCDLVLSGLHLWRKWDHIYLRERETYVQEGPFNQSGWVILSSLRARLVTWRGCVGLHCVYKPLHPPPLSKCWCDVSWSRLRGSSNRGTYILPEPRSCTWILMIPLQRQCNVICPPCVHFVQLKFYWLRISGWSPLR